MKLSLILFFVLFIIPTLGHTQEKRDLLRVCYYSPQTLPPSKLNSTLCTHIIAGFATVKDGFIHLGNDIDKSLYLQTTNLKKKNPSLKVLLSIGGGGNDQGFSSAFNSTGNRTKFIVSSLIILNKYNFDGLDVDWEFPVWNDHFDGDKSNFNFFLQEFTFLAKAYAYVTGRYPSMLTVAVAAPRNIVDSSYNIPQMAKYVDFINLMSYDFHDYFWYTPFTGHNSPLFNRSVEKAYFATLNTAWAASYWNKQGMPKSKIMVGVPTYAHTYKLVNPKINGVDAPADSTFGDLSFSQVCNYLKKGAQRVFDNESEVPYLYLGYDWVSYEDAVSIYGKAKWILSEGYGGIMTYNLNSDDWLCECDKEPFLLHRIIYNVFTTL